MTDWTQEAEKLYYDLNVHELLEDHVHVYEKGDQDVSVIATALAAAYERGQAAAPAQLTVTTEAVAPNDLDEALSEFRRLVDILVDRARGCDGPVTSFLYELFAASENEKDRFRRALGDVYYASAQAIAKAAAPTPEAKL